MSKSLSKLTPEEKAAQALLEKAFKEERALYRAKLAKKVAAKEKRANLINLGRKPGRPRLTPEQRQAAEKRNRERAKERYKLLSAKKIKEKKPDSQKRPNVKHFKCSYANSVAQVYMYDPITKLSPSEIAKNITNPVQAFGPGDCFVLWLHYDAEECEVTHAWPFPVYKKLNRRDAERIALELYEDADPELQYGSMPEDPRESCYILFWNGDWQVRWWPNTDHHKNPFIIFNKRTGRIHMDVRKQPIRFSLLETARQKIAKLCEKDERTRR
jgi:hypothetical protein